jgi:hypothetical protein
MITPNIVQYYLQGEKLEQFITIIDIPNDITFNLFCELNLFNVLNKFNYNSFVKHIPLFFAKVEIFSENDDIYIKILEYVKKRMAILCFKSKKNSKTHKKQVLKKIEMVQGGAK